jgi:hypothetical protein
MNKRIRRQESAFSGKTKQGATPLVVGISFIALALLLGRLNLVFNFFGVPNSHAPFASANLCNRRRPAGIGVSFLGWRLIDPGQRSSGSP